MTDVNGSANAGNPVTTPASVATGSGDTGANAWDGLSEDNRSFVEAKGWKTVDDAFASHRELESKLGKTLSFPDENDDNPDKYDGIYSKLGWPEKPDGYEFKLDAQKVPENMPYSEDMAAAWREFAHGKRMPKAMAEASHDFFVEMSAKQFAAEQEAAQKAAEERRQVEEAQHREIVSKWGNSDQPAYRENVTLADRALREMGLHEAFQKAGLIDRDGVVLDAKAAFSLADIGRRVFSEDSSSNPISRAQSSNPFSAQSKDYTKQSELIALAKSDPSKREGVAALVRQAGIDPKELGL